MTSDDSDHRQDPTPPDQSGALETDMRQALEQLMPALQALDLPPGFTLRTSARRAVAHTLQVARAFADDREEFEAMFEGARFDLRSLTDLADRALALWQADMDLGSARSAGGELQALLAEAQPLRRRLLDAAIYLWSDHEVLGKRVEEIRKGSGHLDLADDLIQLADLFRDNWADARRSRVEGEDLARAQGLAQDLAVAIQCRSTEGQRRLRQIRTRAAFHAYQGVEEVRHAARFVFRAKPARLDEYPAFYAPVPVKRRRKRPAEPIQPDVIDGAADSRVA
jgi:hypothetical protein